LRKVFGDEKTEEKETEIRHFEHGPNGNNGLGTK